MISISASRACRARGYQTVCAVAIFMVLWAYGCQNQTGGLLGTLDTGSKPTPIDPLALPAASQPSGPAADADKAIHEWIRAALAAQVRINIQNAPAARTIVADLP